MKTASRSKEWITALCMLTGSFIAYRHYDSHFFLGLFIFAVLLCLAAVFAPKIFAHVYVCLDKLLSGALWLFSMGVLGLLFLMIFIPGRLILLLKHSDVLGLKLKPDKESYWIQAKPDGLRSEDSFKRQF